MTRLIDKDSPRFDTPNITIDEGKNQRACNQLHTLMKQCILQSRQALRRASNIIERAPGTRDELVAMFDSSEQIELNAFFKKAKSLGNDLRGENTPALSEALRTPQSDRRSKREAGKAK